MILTTKPKVMIFDLDGTLADTMPQIIRAVKRTAHALRYNAPSESSIKNYFSSGIETVLSHMICGRHDFTIAHITRSSLAQAMDVFTEYFYDEICHDFYIYDGVRDALDYFESWDIKMAVVTNKHSSIARPVIKALILDDYFDVILPGSIIKNRKPDSKQLLRCLDLLGGYAPQESVFVGDTAIDVQAGTMAGMATVGMTYGYDGEFGIRTLCKSDYVCTSMEELRDVIGELPDY